MPSPLTEEDLITLTNKFEKWKDYLNNNSSPQDYPSFSPFFNCISSIRETFFQNTLANLPFQNTNYHNNSSNDNNNNNNNYNYEKRKSNSTTTITAEMEKRADLVAIPKNPHRGEGDGEGEGRSKTITDLPNEILAMILEYLLPYYISIQRFVQLTLVSKVWHRMVHAVSGIDIHNSVIHNYSYYFKTNGWFEDIFSLFHRPLYRYRIDTNEV